MQIDTDTDQQASLHPLCTRSHTYVSFRMIIYSAAVIVDIHGDTVQLMFAVHGR